MAAVGIWYYLMDGKTIEATPAVLGYESACRRTKDRARGGAFSPLYPKACI
jgi:hypothetical protein